MPKLTPVSAQEFKKRFKRLGLKCDCNAGKGGEWIVKSPDGVIFTMPHLSEGDDVLVPYIKGVLRRFDIKRERWFEAKEK